MGCFCVKRKMNPKHQHNIHSHKTARLQFAAERQDNVHAFCRRARCSGEIRIELFGHKHTPHQHEVLQIN